MILSVVVVERGPVPGVARRELNRINKKALLSLGHFWFRKMLPKHFTTKGAREYQYRPRAGEPGSTRVRNFRSSYTGRKLRLFGHRLPLVWSGSSRTLATGLKNIRGTSRRVFVAITAPTLNRTPRKQKRTAKSMREEVTAISPGDQARLVKLYDQRLEQLLKQIKTRRRRRIV